MLNASTFTFSINEHCHAFFAHSRIFRAHMKITDTKMISIQRVLKFFDVFEIMNFKFMIQFEFVRFEKRILNEIDQNRRALISIIINFVSKSVSTMSTMIEKFKIRDLNLIMKHFDKNVIENLKNKIAKQIIAQINNEIVKIQKKFFVFENKMMTFKQFKNENVFFFDSLKKNVIFFSRFIQWIKMFDANVRMQKKIYEILMHSIRINQLNFLLFQNFAKTIKILIVDNIFRISKIVTVENFVVVYMKWLKKLISLKITKWFTINLKFTFSKTINAVIIKFLIWKKKNSFVRKITSQQNR